MKIIFWHALLDCRDVLVAAVTLIGMAQIAGWCGV